MRRYECTHKHWKKNFVLFEGPRSGGNRDEPILGQSPQLRRHQDVQEIGARH